jgi:hypothetical protein
VKDQNTALEISTDTMAHVIITILTMISGYKIGIVVLNEIFYYLNSGLSSIIKISFFQKVHTRKP